MAQAILGLDKKTLIVILVVLCIFLVYLVKGRTRRIKEAFSDADHSLPFSYNKIHTGKECLPNSIASCPNEYPILGIHNRLSYCYANSNRSPHPRTGFLACTLGDTFKNEGWGTLEEGGAEQGIVESCNNQYEVYLGTYDTVDECAAACKAKKQNDCTWFIYGTGAKAKACYWEKNCDINNLEDDHYDVYKMS